MSFRFSRQGLDRPERCWQRALEMLPGAISWSLLVGMIGVSFWNPRLAAVLIIAFDLYWLFRLGYATLLLVLSYLRLSVERDTDWMVRLEEVERSRQLGARPGRTSQHGGWRRRLSHRFHARALRALRHHG